LVFHAVNSISEKPCESIWSILAECRNLVEGLLAQRASAAKKGRGRHSRAKKGYLFNKGLKRKGLRIVSEGFYWLRSIALDLSTAPLSSMRAGQTKVQCPQPVQ